MPSINSSNSAILSKKRRWQVTMPPKSDTLEQSRPRNLAPRGHALSGGGSQGPEAECIGKSRGGPNTKVHALVDGKRRIVYVFLSPGNRHDSLFGIDLCNAAPNGVTILADKAYDSDDLRAFLEDIGLGCCIPPKANRVNPAPYDKQKYKKRHRVENAFQCLKEFRAIATRYEKLASTFLGLVKLGSILQWL